MAILKQIKFGKVAHDIAKTVLTPKEGGVMSVAAPNGVTNKDDEQANYQYELDVNVDDSTIKKSEGKLTVGTVPAVQVSVADEAGVFTAENVETVLKELKDDIAKVDGKAKSYKIVKETTGLETNVKEQYKLQQTVGEKTDFVGETIKIYKDSSLESVALDGQTLNFTYNLADGSTSTVGVDVSTFLAESEFKDGLQLTDHVISVKLGQGLVFGGETGENKSINVKIDSTSSDAEKFLSVGTNGVKISGVQNAINNAVAALDVTDDNAVAGQYVAAIQETNGIVSVKTRANVSMAVLNEYAKGSDASAVAASDTINKAISKLENQVDAAKAATTAAIEALDVTDTAADGQVVTAVSETDGKVSSTKANFAGIKLGGFAQDTSATGAIDSSDTLAAALNKLENKIDAAADDHTVVKHANSNTHVTVSDVQNDNGSTTYTVTENDIASAQALTNEIKRAQDAEKEIADKVGLTGAEGSRTFAPTQNYGTGSTNVVENMQKLDTKLKEVADGLAAVQYKVSGTTLEFFGISENKTV